MAEGLTRWEEQFQEINIGKIARRIDTRMKIKPHLVADPPAKKEHKSTRNRFRKTIASGQKSITGSLSNFLSPKKTSCQAEKQEVQELRTIATSKYGLVFSKEDPGDKVDVSLDEFKRRDQEIFERFISSVHESRNSCQ